MIYIPTDKRQFARKGKLSDMLALIPSCGAISKFSVIYPKLPRLISSTVVGLPFLFES